MREMREEKEESKGIYFFSPNDFRQIVECNLSDVKNSLRRVSAALLRMPHRGPHHEDFTYLKHF